MVALVLDLGGARRDRNADQMSADAMALAAAVGARRRRPRPASPRATRRGTTCRSTCPRPRRSPPPSCSTFAACAPRPSLAQVDGHLRGVPRSRSPTRCRSSHALLQGRRPPPTTGRRAIGSGCASSRSRDNLFAAGDRRPRRRRRRPLRPRGRRRQRPAGPAVRARVRRAARHRQRRPHGAHRRRRAGLHRHRLRRLGLHRTRTRSCSTSTARGASPPTRCTCGRWPTATPPAPTAPG